MKNKNQYPEPIVGALIINKNSKLLFCRSHKWKNKYTIFGGHVEIGETMEKALEREVKEETGLKVKVDKFLGVSDFIFGSDFHEKKHFIFIDFLCRYNKGDHKININEEYIDDCKWMTIKQAEQADLAGGAKLILKEFKKYLKNN